MYKQLIILPLIIASTCGNTAGDQSTVSGMLPARTLECSLGRATNLDPTRNQSLDEIRYEGAHLFSLHLPAIPKRQVPPPDPSEPPEPVNPATQITFDPAGLAKDHNSGFDRVIDLWPERVEMARIINPPMTRLIIISDIDTANGNANLFMAQAADAASMDLDRVYQGSCRIKSVSAGLAH